jgi:hypothetical protein
VGRGLSELQKEILKIAYRNQVEKGEKASSGLADVSNREVLVKVYGFVPEENKGLNKDKPFIFNRRVIGAKRYQSASTAVAKAFKRLSNRGLAHRKYSYGIILTETGNEVARALYRSS